MQEIKIREDIPILDNQVAIITVTFANNNAMIQGVLNEVGRSHDCIKAKFTANTGEYREKITSRTYRYRAERQLNDAIIDVKYACTANQIALTFNVS